MKVAIDTGPLASGHAVRGIGVHTLELLLALKELRQKEIEVRGVDFQGEDLSKYDIVHYQNFHPYFMSIPWKTCLPAGRNRQKLVVTIHDLIPLIYPKHYPPGVRGKIRFLLQKFLLKNVDSIITISETSKKDICRFLGVVPEKVYVVYLAPKKTFRKLEIQKRYDLPERFVLYVGDINYNKNIPGLIKACSIVKIPLVICGKQALEVEELGMGLDILKGPSDYLRFLFNIPHPELSHYKEVTESIKINKDILRLGFIPDKDLVAIYNLATVYCQPSFYEGFGLPVLEAMACGCPVIAAKTQALVEIAEGAAVFSDPKDPEDMADKLKKIVSSSSLQSKYKKLGLSHVKKFSWEKTAKLTLNVYKEVLSR